MNHTSLNGRPARRTSTVTESPSGQKRRAQRRRRFPKATAVFYWTASVVPWALAVLLLAVSMPHLASGFMSITGCGALAGWLLAIAIDLAQVTAKLQLTVSKQYKLSSAAKWTSAAIIAGTSLMSMALNVLAFLGGANDATGTALAWVAGIMLPLLVLALSYTGSCFALAKPKPARSK